MATKRKKKIDITTPVKKNELSFDYMTLYIEDKFKNDKGALEKAKAEFKANAVEEVDGEKKYSPKKARAYFVENYAEAVILKAEKKQISVLDKLDRW